MPGAIQHVGGGAAILNPTSSSIVDSNIFRYNSVLSSAQPGPGLYCNGKGGGLSITTVDSFSTSGTIQNNTFIENDSITYGGGMYAQYPQIVKKNYFYKNISGDGGGAFLRNSSTTSILMSHNYYVLNSAISGSGSGGGLFILPHANGVAANISYEYFEQNTAGFNGGAVSIKPQAVTMSNMYFINNTAGSNGGAVNLDAYIAPSSIIDSTFLNNTAGIGFSIYMNDDQTLSNIYVSDGVQSFSGCPAAGVEGSVLISACSSPGTTFATTGYGFCSVTNPGEVAPAGCVGPSWIKP